MTSANILVTGAAGFIGGSIVADFLSGTALPLQKGKIIAAVRSEEQAAALSSAGITTIRLDLANGEAVTRSIIEHDVSIAIHTASAMIPDIAVNLITGLSQQRKRTGQQTYFIHTSALSAFLQKTGWPSEKLHDTRSDIFETEKQLADSYPVRKTDVTVIEHAQAEGVISFIVVVCLTHGKGTGSWNKLSINYPLLIRASIERKEVQRFADKNQIPHVHISDLTALYGRIVEEILHNEDPPNGRSGYYFPKAYLISSYDFADDLAAALHTRGLVSSPKPRVWSSAEAAAEALGVPVQFVEFLWNTGGDIPAGGLDNGDQIGWKPKWDKKRFISNIDDEIDTVLELGKAKSSFVDSLFAAVKQ